MAILSHIARGEGVNGIPLTGVGRWLELGGRQ